MKLLVISHSCMVGVNQRVYVELIKYREMELRILVPRVWREATTRRKMFFDQDSPLKDLIIFGDVIFPGGITKHFYVNEFSKPFIKFKPDIVFIDEEPQCLATFQFLVLSKIFKTKAIFRIVENIVQSWPFPFSRIESYVIRQSDGAVAAGKEASSVLTNKGYARSIPIIPFAVDPNLFSKRDVGKLKNKLNLKGFVIGYMGRLHKSKGILTLVKAVSELTRKNLSANYQLFIVGSGYLKDKIHSLTKELRIEDKLVMFESVPHNEAVAYFNCMDVCVLPSITTPTWKEQFGRVLIEAMACEVPVVGSNSGEIPRIIENTGGGLVFQEGDAEDLREKLVIIIKDRDLREKLGIKGRKNVIEKYACAKVAQRLHDVFQEVLDGDGEDRQRGTKE